jgi:hypothetical protein
MNEITPVGVTIERHLRWMIIDPAIVLSEMARAGLPLWRAHGTVFFRMRRLFEARLKNRVSTSVVHRLCSQDLIAPDVQNMDAEVYFLTAEGWRRGRAD